MKKIVYGLTADECRRNAVDCARAAEKCTVVHETVDLATLGTFWSTLGLLLLATGDPDGGKIVGVEK